MKNEKMLSLALKISQGQERALAQALTVVDNRQPGYQDLIKALYNKGSKARLLGITGPPGAGKSSLTRSIVHRYLTEGKKVGVILIDPSSPFSGGALLGDRVRMMDLAGLENVFIRSMASKGALGGLSPATMDAVYLMEAFGCTDIIIETVGVGQSEVDIVGSADTVLVVLMPKIGDEVQALKAGLMEIGDIFVINKADQDGADSLLALLKNMATLENDSNQLWEKPFIKTSALKEWGVEELITAINAHQKYLTTTNQGNKRRLNRSELAVNTHLEARLRQMFIAPIQQLTDYKELIKKVEAKDLAPTDCAEELMGRVLSRFRREQNEN